MNKLLKKSESNGKAMFLDLMLLIASIILAGNLQVINSLPLLIIAIVAIVLATIQVVARLLIEEKICDRISDLERREEGWD